MRVHITARLDQGLVARIEARAEVEQRTLTGMLERLLTLGLGTVVTERADRVPQGDGALADGLAHVSASAVDDLRESARVGTARSVTSVCENERFHRVGVFCKTCERVI